MLKGRVEEPSYLRFEEEEKKTAMEDLVKYNYEEAYMEPFLYIFDL